MNVIRGPNLADQITKQKKTMQFKSLQNSNWGGGEGGS